MRITTFASGSSGNCTLASLDGAHFLIDAGISFKRIREHLSLSGMTPEDLTAVLITHDHVDHISGLATMMKRSAVPVLAPRAVANHLRYAVPGIEAVLREFPVGEEVRMDGVFLRAFHTPHDTEESVGWRLTGERQSFALATDMGCVTEEIRDGLRGADIVLIEANHDVDMLKTGPYPFHLKKRILSDHGHLSNESCAALAAELARGGTRYIVLGHLSRENNTPARAFRTVAAALERMPSVQLYVAPAADRLTIEMEKSPICLP